MDTRADWTSKYGCRVNARAFSGVATGPHSMSYQRFLRFRRFPAGGAVIIVERRRSDLEPNVGVWVVFSRLGVRNIQNMLLPSSQPSVIPFRHD